MTPEQEELMLNNMRLVYKTANRYRSEGRNCGYDLDDLISIGSIGLAVAATNYDPSYGTKFSTLAVPYIRGSIHMALRDDRGGPKFSRKTYLRYLEIKRKHLEFMSVRGIATILHCTNYEVSEAIALERGNFSLDSEVPTNAPNRSEQKAPSYFIDSIGTKDSDRWIEIRDFIRALPTKLKPVAELLFRDMEQKEIACMLGVSPQYLSQKLVARIRKAWKKYSEEE